MTTELSQATVPQIGMDWKVIEGAVYGREDALAQLSGAYQRCLHANEERELVVIMGPSGGKWSNGRDGGTYP